MYSKAAIIITGILAGLFINPPLQAQGGKRQEMRASSTTSKQGAFAAPALPLEVRFGYYRDDYKAISLAVRNDDPSRMILSLLCSILITDMLQKKTTRLSLLEFDYPLKIKPGETGVAVITEDDPVTLDWSNHVIGVCAGYNLTKDEDRASGNIFVADQCKSDRYTLVVEAIKFSDGSMWKGQKKE